MQEATASARKPGSRDVDHRSLDHRWVHLHQQHPGHALQNGARCCCGMCVSVVGLFSPPLSPPHGIANLFNSASPRPEACEEGAGCAIEGHTSVLGSEAILSQLSSTCDESMQEIPNGLKKSMTLVRGKRRQDERHNLPAQEKQVV